MTCFLTVSTRRWFALSVVSLAVVGSARAAQACEAPGCSINGYAAPRAGTTVPANVPALRYVPTVASPDVGDPFQLSTDTGPVAFTADQTDSSLVRLLAPLTEGKTYEIRHLQSCSPANHADTDFVTQTFVAGPAAPLPTTSGSLELTKTTIEDSWQVDTSSGSCTTTLKAAVELLTFTPSADLQPYLPVTSFTLSIAGMPYRSASTGADPNAPAKGFFFSRPILQLHAACDLASEADKWADYGVKLGTYDLVWQATIAGASTQPAPLTGKITFACDGSAAFVPTSPSGSGGSGGGSGTGGTGGSASVGGTGGASGSSTAGSAGAAGIHDYMGDDMSDDAPGSGCTVNVAGPTRASALPALVLAIGAALRARRTPRRR